MGLERKKIVGRPKQGWRPGHKIDRNHKSNSSSENKKKSSPEKVIFQSKGMRNLEKMRELENKARGLPKDAHRRLIKKDSSSPPPCLSRLIG